MASSDYIKRQIPVNRQRARRSGPNFKQGTFDEYKPQKYYGPRPIIYRSSWEFRFMQQMELNPNVVKWSSENIQIPYTLMERNEKGKFVEKRHTYNIDFTVHLKNGHKYVVEVKPLSQSPKTVEQIKRNPVMYKNARKWKAALEWCKQAGYKFIVVTEEQLKTSIFA